MCFRLISDIDDSLREQKQVAEIERSLIDTFNDKLQLRKTIIEIEDANSTARYDIERKKEEIHS